MQQVIDVLGAERDELRSGLLGLRSRSSSSAATTTERPRALRRPEVAGGQPRKERAVAVLPGASLQGDSKVKIVNRVSKHPGSTAGDVAKELDPEHTGTRLAQMAKSGELKMAARRYKAA
jgi:hypothetical protein